MPPAAQAQAQQHSGRLIGGKASMPQIEHHHTLGRNEELCRKRRACPLAIELPFRAASFARPCQRDALDRAIDARKAFKHLPCAPRKARSRRAFDHSGVKPCKGSALIDHARSQTDIGRRG